MPLITKIQLLKPSALDAGLNFRHSRVIDSTLDPLFPLQGITVAGSAADGSGLYYEAGSGLVPQFSLTRIGSFAQYLLRSDTYDYGRFQGVFDIGAGVLSSGSGTFTQISSMCNINGVAWITGTNQNGTFRPFVIGMSSGQDLYNGGNWANRSAPFFAALPNSVATFVRLAANTNNLYVTLTNLSSPFDIRIFRASGAGAPSNAFTQIGSFANGGATITGYAVHPDGLIHFISTDSGAHWRSLDGGVNWNPVTVPGTGGGLLYSKLFDRWISHAQGGPIYSDSNGAIGTWNSATVNGNTATFGKYMTIVQPLDTEGRYYVGFLDNDGANGPAPFSTYVTEDAGKSWYHSQSLLGPHFNVSDPINTLGKLAVIHTGRRILVYQVAKSLTSWNGDYSVFSSGAIDL